MLGLLASPFGGSADPRRAGFLAGLPPELPSEELLEEAAILNSKQPRRADGRSARRLGTRNQQASRAEALFVRALEAHLPSEAIDELQCFPSPLDYMLELGKLYGECVGPDGFVFEPGVELLAPWRDWAHRWNIAAECAILWASHVTLEWRRTGRRPEFPLPIHFADGTPQLAREHRTIQSPNPLAESREDAADRARREWDEQAARLKTIAEAQSGLALRPVEPTPKMSLQCEWTVKRRLLKCSYEQLAASHDGRDGGADIATISKGIKRIEALIGLGPYRPLAFQDDPVIP